MWKCRPTSVEMRRCCEPRDRLGRLVDGEPELRVRLPGRDRMVGVAGDARRDPHQHLLVGVAVGGDPLEAVEVVRASPGRCGRLRHRAPRTAPALTWRCRAGRSGPGQSPPATRGTAPRPRRRHTPGPPRRGRGRPPCRGTPWTRTARRSPRGAPRPRRGTSGRGFAGPARRRRRRASRTRARARSRRSHRSRGGRARSRGSRVGTHDLVPTPSGSSGAIMP